MKVQRVSVEYSETRSANFQSVSALVGLVAELEPGDTYDRVQLDLEAECVRLVNAAFDRQQDRRVEELVAAASFKNGGADEDNPSVRGARGEAEAAQETGEAEDTPRLGIVRGDGA